MTSILPAFLPFALVAAFTPGPNNLMVAASGVNFGYRRSMPHMAGVILGFPVLMVLVGLGLGELFRDNPMLHHVLKVAGSIYLVFLAWKIASSAGADGAGRKGAPLSFLQAALFQWANPKAWMMILSAVTAYTTPAHSYTMQVLAMSAISLVVTIASTNTWCLFGLGLRNALTSRPVLLRGFNITMALLLVASLLPAWI